MTKTSGEFEIEFIETAEKKTGRTIEEWLPIVQSAGFDKQSEITGWLKTAHEFNHLQASLLAGIYLNNGKPVYQDENSLLDSQFKECEEVRPLFTVISKKILELFPDAHLIPKKTYLSYSAIKEFAAINIRPNEIYFGMALGELPFTEVLQKSRLVGPMPRISHMVVINNARQVDQEFFKHLQLSYCKAHKKNYLTRL